MQAPAYKYEIAPIFEAISTRSSQNLNADYFALMIIDPTRMSCELYINKEAEIGFNIKKQLGDEAPKAWLNCRQNDFKHSYSLLNKEFYNIGLGLGFKAGPLHMYMISDTYPLYFTKGTPIPTRLKGFRFQFGFNLLFGCNQEKKMMEDEPLIE